MVTLLSINMNKLKFNNNHSPLKDFIQISDQQLLIHSSDLLEANILY